MKLIGIATILNGIGIICLAISMLLAALKLSAIRSDFKNLNDRVERLEGSR